MHSWVRYSVSAYLGLLLAGSIASPGPAAHQGPTPVASIREMREDTTYYLVPGYPGYVNPPVESTESSALAES